MKSGLTFTAALRRASFLLVACLSLTAVTRAETAPALLDDYSDAHRNKIGAERLVITDQGIGGQSQGTPSCANGVLSMQGELAPARGQPAFISFISPVSTDGQPRDASGYQGVRLKVKVKQGMLSVQVSSTDIQNYDYQTSAPITRNPDAFQEVKIPFNTMKRAWSEQTPLNLKDVTSVNLVAVGMAKGTFAYEIDEIGFY